MVGLQKRRQDVHVANAPEPALTQCDVRELQGGRVPLWHERHRGRHLLHRLRHGGLHDPQQGLCPEGIHERPLAQELRHRFG